jgi:nucleotidyltransferase substrate binding protein (TIGR01987 family)
VSQKKVIQTFESLGKALITLEVMVNKPMQEDRGNIDACIQRFEFVIELYWKLLKRILETQGREAYYPKDVLREAYAGYLIDDDSLWLQMLKDRNLTSHTYDEKLADKIYANIKSYFPTLKNTYEKLYKKYK